MRQPSNKRLLVDELLEKDFDANAWHRLSPETVYTSLMSPGTDTDTEAASAHPHSPPKLKRKRGVRLPAAGTEFFQQLEALEPVPESG